MKKVTEIKQFKPYKREHYERNTIVIHSGEGDRGLFAYWTGKDTEQAIKARLTQETNGGDRWAHAYRFAYTSRMGEDIYMGIFGEERRKVIPAEEIQD